jgi:hypothetical protein
MAYIVAHRSGAWEIRESRATPEGPRSYTLASFRTLTPEVIARAQTRSSKPLDPDRLHKAAARVGAPIAARPSDRVAGELLSELAAGRRPRPVLRRLLLDVLQGADGRSSDSARAAAGWIGATPRQRGDTLRDLLLLTDRIPRRRRPAQLTFPRVNSAPA